MKIFSLNCWLLPPPFSAQNRSRLQAIIAQIRQHNPDVIALQEVWLRRYASRIAANLPGYAFTWSKSLIVNQGGLLTGIRQGSAPCGTGRFPITKRHSLVERLAQKGYHLVRLSDGTLLINTHLYAPTGQSEKKITAAQFRMLQRLMRRRTGLLFGDLNLDEEEIMRHGGVFKLETSCGTTVSRANPFTDSRLNRAAEKDQRLDYALATKSGGLSVRTKCLKDPVLSDHYALFSEIIVEKRSKQSGIYRWHTKERTN